VLNTKTTDKSKIRGQLFNVRMLRALMSKIDVLLTCNREKLPVSINSVRMILVGFRIIVREIHIVACILINNALWIAFRFRREEYVWIRSIVDNGAKIRQLVDRMNSLTSAMVGILMENINVGTMLCLDKASNSANRDFLYSIISNAINISG
jgi:hypothetical protein